MSNVDLKCGVSFYVESTNKTYRSFANWGLRCINTDRIGNPVENTHYISVPNLNKKIDLTEAVTGRPTYSHRQLKIVLAGVRNEADWESIVSTFRNAIDGRICQITFDNDIAYYWRGRVHVEDFSSVMRLGTLTIKVPECEPYKYNAESTAEPWKWDPFNFETGVISEPEAQHIDGRKEITIPRGFMYVAPEFVVSNKIGNITVQNKGKTYALKEGTNRIPSILVNGDTEEVLTFEGTADVLIVYRGGSL